MPILVQILFVSLSCSKGLESRRDHSLISLWLLVLLLYVFVVCCCCRLLFLFFFSFSFFLHSTRPVPSSSFLRLPFFIHPLLVSSSFLLLSYSSSFSPSLLSTFSFVPNSSSSFFLRRRLSSSLSSVNKVVRAKSVKVAYKSGINQSLVASLTLLRESVSSSLGATMRRLGRSTQNTA